MELDGAKRLLATKPIFTAPSRYLWKEAKRTSRFMRSYSFARCFGLTCGVVVELGLQLSLHVRRLDGEIVLDGSSWS